MAVHMSAQGVQEAVTVLTKSTSDGREVVIKMWQHLPERRIFGAYLAGKEVVLGECLNKLRAPLHKHGLVLTHAVGIICTHG